MAVERWEVVTIPLSDVERAREFYARLGWRLDGAPPAAAIGGRTPSHRTAGWGLPYSRRERGADQNGASALAAVRAHRPDGPLLDLHPPEADELTAARRSSTPT
ncbi:hypothetical protein V2W30_40605 (plasmid) [Streptomyces sp. Q6]|uniref:Uncharacterized protein n=1 Tax=Streptomyces citrinus TaxID=3118173 RepID=A0ACD5AR02_9ACTN